MATLETTNLTTTMMEDTELNALVQTVAQARRQTAQAQAALTTVRAAFEQQHAEVIAAVTAAQARLEQAEEALRQATLAAYAGAGNKRPHPAVAVRVMTRLVYDPEGITAWARENLPAILVLDVKTFERVAQHLMVPGVTVSAEPVATIAQDLTPWHMPDDR